MDQIELRPFTIEEYHAFFRQYESDPMMDPSPFRYRKEQVTRSYIYNHDPNRKDYAHFGIFLKERPVGSFQLKRMDFSKGHCEFGIILQNDQLKNRGIGSAAIRSGMRMARDYYGMNTMTGDTMGRNRRMIHVFEKLGFQLIEIVPEAYQLPDGQKEDRLIYRIQLTEGKSA